MYETILVLLGIENPVPSVENQIWSIITLTSQRLKLMINQTEVPSELEYIVVEVSVKRYNKIGSEGVSSHSVEGESMAWSDDDFKEYQDEIQSWIELNDDSSTGRGNIQFL